MKKVLIISTCSIFLAITTVLSFYTIRVSADFQISFSEIPILFSGYLFGPLWGALTGFANDCITMIMKGYSPSIMTIGKIAVGLIPGIALLIIGKKKLYKNVILLFLITFVTLSLRTFINSVGMVVQFGSTVDAQYALAGFKTLMNLVDSTIFVLIAFKLLPMLDKMLNKNSF